MRSRVLPLLVLPLLLSVPASGLLLTPLPDDQLARAAERLKSRDYAGARQLALKTAEGGMRDFVAGYSAYRSGGYEEAAGLLDRAATSYPLLGDYALFFRADALFRTERLDGALLAVRQLLREYPDSILRRRGLLLEADILYARKEWGVALTAYLTFVEKYAEGSDAVTALSRMAACREALGEKEAAAGLYRSLWLNHPASPLAEPAEGQLRLLAAAGVPVPPFSREELFQRASTLSDLRRYEAVLPALDAIPAGNVPDELSSRILLKKGQTLYNLRRYRDAEELLSRLEGGGAAALRDDILYWHARALDKIDRDDDAVRTYLSLAESFPKSPKADDALLQAALIRKEQRNTVQTVTLLERLLRAYPQTAHRQRALWEIGWTRYLAGDHAAAAERFRKLAESPETREKALYWLGRSYEASGNRESAGTVFAMLAAEYPSGFYAVRYVQGRGTSERVVSPAEFTRTVPVPAGYERIKALITLGLADEARLELAAERKKLGKAKSVTLARLYLELGDYKTPMGLVRPEGLTTVTADTLRLWNLSYPLPFREPVTEQAGRSGIPESLIYAVIRTESSFSPTVQSPAGAVGLMQLMPATAREVAGKGQTVTAADLTRPELNIFCGVRHLKDLLKLHDNSLVLAVAAYNAGSGNVNRWRKRFGSLREDEFIETIPFGETREYVKKVLGGAELYHRLYNLEPLSVLSALPASRQPSPAAPPATAVSRADGFATFSTARPIAPL